MEKIEFDRLQNDEWRELRLCCLDCCVSEWVCVLKNGERVQVNEKNVMRQFRADHKGHDLVLRNFKNYWE